MSLRRRLPRHRAPRRRTPVRSALVVALVIVVVSTSVAWAFFTATSVPGGGGAAAATEIGQGATPSVTASGSAVTLGWTASTLPTGIPVSGYRIRRYDADTSAERSVGSDCSGRITALTCTETGVPTGSWRYTVTPVLAARWVGEESDRSAEVDTDSRMPGNSLSLSDVSGGAALLGGTVFYRGVAGGSLRLLNDVSSPGLFGAASSRTSALSGDATGWSHAPSTVTTPPGGPYRSAAFSWAPGTTSSPTEVVTGRSFVGNQASTTLTFTDDSAPPTPGSLDYPDGEVAGSSVSVTFAAGSDSGSGIASGLLQRATAPRTDGTCGTFGAFGTVAGGTNPTSPFTDSVSVGSCYQYRYVVTDAVGNQDVATSTHVAAVTAGARWALDEGSGSTAADSSGHAQTLTLQSGAGWARGTIGSGALFLTGGSDSWASTPGPVVDTSQSFTVAAWVKFSSLNGYQTLASIDGSRVSPFYLQKNDAGQFSFEVYGYDSEFGSAGRVDGLSPTAGTWYHVAGVYDHQAGSTTLYVDGVSQGTLGGVSAFRATGSTNVGRSLYGGPTDFVSGSEDDVRFFDRPLSGAEVGALMSSRNPGPSGGSVDATGLTGTDGRYSTSTSTGFALDPGSDPDGVATSGNRLMVAGGTLSDGSCGPYSADVLLAVDPPTSPSYQTNSGLCYRFRYRVADGQGNTTTYTSPDVKIDASPPSAPSVALSGSGATYASGSTLYYRSAAPSGSFTVTASGSSDAESGVAGYTFPVLGAGWTSVAGGPGSTTYAWSSAGPSGPGSQSVTAGDGAGLSASSSFTVTADDAGPTGGSVSYADGSTTASSVPVSFTTATDAGSGVARSELQRATATLTGTTCGGYSPWSTVASGTSLSSPVSDPISTGTCYVYRYLVYDNVGNVATWTSSSVVKAVPTYAQTVAATSGLLDFYPLDEPSGASQIADSAGSAPGSYHNGVGLGFAGATTSSSDTAARFDGTDDYGDVPRTVADDFSVEFWFSSTQGNSYGSQWWEGAGLVDAEVNGNHPDFGVSLRADGRVAAGVGTNDTTVTSSVSGLNDGTWHHVVFTRVRSTGALTLYVDGVNVGTAVGSTLSLTASPDIYLGRVHGGASYAGYLDDVALYDRALPAGTVQGHYAAR